jgi:hypothetical protein
MYDSVYAEWFGVHDLPMRLHHLGAVIGATCFYFTTVGRSIAVICIIVEEISNPCILIRKIYKAKGETDSTWYVINEIVFAAVFCLFRTVGATMAMYNSW